MNLQHPHSEQSFEKLHRQGESSREFLREFFRRENFELAFYLALAATTFYSVVNAPQQQKKDKQPQQVEAKP